MAKIIQPSFAKGEISSELFGRVDLRAYQIALKRARNCVVHQYGGISNRSGTKFIAPCKQHSAPPRLIPFQFKTTDTHVLEFGHEYIRFLRNDAHIADLTATVTGASQANPVEITTSVAHTFSSGQEVFLTAIGGMTEITEQRFTITVTAANRFTLQDQVTGANIDGNAFGAYTSGGSALRIYEIASPYQQVDLRSLRYTQTADVMTLTHSNYPPKELRRLALDNWELVDIVFRPTIDFPTTLATSGGSGGVDAYYMVTAIAANGEESLGGINTTAHAITAITQADPVVVTSAAHGFTNGQVVHIDNVVGMTELNDRRFSVSNVAANTFELTGEDGTGYGAYVSGGNAWLTAVFNTNDTNVTITWSAVANAVRYRVFKLSQGVFGFLATTDANTYLDPGTIVPDIGDTPPRLVEPFLGTDNQPMAVGFHQQRMVMGGSNNRPDTSYFSVVGNFNNFSSAVPIRADDGFSTTLSSREVNEIRHYVSVKDLLISTSGAEWAMAGTNQDSRFSIDTINQNQQTNWGSGELPPIIIGQTVLFTTPSQNSVRSISFSFEHDHYNSDDLSILANHMFKYNTVLEWSRVKIGDPIVFVVRDDGQLLAFTYNEEQEVAAWTTWDTDGDFESVACILPNADSIYDQPYFVVKRKINGNTVRYIERAVDRLFQDVQDCFFVDSGLTFDNPLAIEGISNANPLVITITGHGLTNGDTIDIEGIEWPTTLDEVGNVVIPTDGAGNLFLNGYRYFVANATANTFTLQSIEDLSNINGTAYPIWEEGGNVRLAVLEISGLFHLKNEPVAVLADGSVIANLTVQADGGLTLPRRFSRIHVGLGYIADIETLPAEPPQSSFKSLQAQRKKVSKVTVRFDKSRGLLVGPDSSHLVEMKQREFEVMGAPTELLTGDKDIAIQSNWNNNGRLFLRQKDPLPTTILALVADTDVGEL